jgi:alpha-galactosidase
MENKELFDKQPIRFEIMKEFGYFVTESSRHMSEYVPWFQHEQEKMEPFVMVTKGIKEKRQAWFEDMGVKTSDAESLKLVLSHEYASQIIETVYTGVPFRFNGNVMNNGLIDNLPQNCCVEVPCLTDRLGVHPCRIGNLPPQLAALNRNSINVQELIVEAIHTRDKQTAFQAVLVDESVGAVLSITEARKMFEEMWEMEGELLSWYDK